MSVASADLRNGPYCCYVEQMLLCLTSGLAAATTRTVLRAGLEVDTRTLAGRRAVHEAVTAAIAADALSQMLSWVSPAT